MNQSISIKTGPLPLAMCCLMAVSAWGQPIPQWKVDADAQNGESLSTDKPKLLDNTLKYFNMITFDNDLKWRFESAIPTFTENI